MGQKSAVAANNVIAVDGPGASGKGTLARRLAAHFDFAYLDSGRLYRAVALRCSRAGIGADQEAAAAAEAGRITDADLDDPALRAEGTERLASLVAALPLVRKALVDYQRSFATHPPDGAGGAVIDGRDIGTVICPDARVKLFITASVEERASRRHKELLSGGAEAIYPAVLRDLKDRDARDTTRSAAPLAQAKDALLIDTTFMDADAAFAAALAYAKSRLVSGTN